ncbi:MAG: chemotaxis protein CheX [Dehalococcoidia bacterium]|nr:chemotaxis protein CheX [Dehalococcoidia bacterium]
MSDTEFGPWADLIQLGTRKAMQGLSEMIGADIEVNNLSLRCVPVTEVSNAFGGRDEEAVGIYLSVSGSADGHLMLMYEPAIALAFVDLLMGQPLRTTDSLDGMGRSALGEMGNVIGAFFLGAIADATGLALSPSPPSVMTDMAGALLDVVSADILLTQDETYLAEATFRVQGQDVNGVFMVMPTQELFETIVSSTKVA